MNTGPAPFKIVKSNTEGSNQRSSFWVVAVCSFEEPAAMYSETKLRNPVAAKPLIIIENDAINVTLNDTKDSFGKMANVSLKSTNVYYPALVHNGDWIFIWMFDTQAGADVCTTQLKAVMDGGAVGTKLCDYKSGLKHVGRITSVATSDTMAGESRIINQSITSQGFLEFATSIYYVYNIPGSVVPTSTASSGDTNALAALNQAAVTEYQSRGLDRSLTGLATKFEDFYKETRENADFSPDTIVAMFFFLIMGIDSDASANKIGNVKGTFNDGIAVPNAVGKILGRPNAKKIWQLYRMNLGVESYAPKGEWFKTFSPLLKDSDDLVRRSATRCKGFVPFTPTMWSNQSMWSILEQYVNPVCNEMFTSLRLDKDGLLGLTITVREKPFSTGLIDIFTADGKVDSSVTAKSPGATSPKTSLNKLSEAFSNGQAKGSVDDERDLKPSITFGSTFGGLSNIIGATGPGAGENTKFATLPRWVIDPSVVRSFSWSTDESRRINFVQVFGRNAASELVGGIKDQETLKQSQLVSGNFVADEVDIARHGLRAQIVESPFDMFTAKTTSGSLAPLWARMNADWLFNGHLKAYGSITLDGCIDPIAVGDNLQYQGILFHIEGVSQSCSNAGGNKTWTTTITLSNGILAESMKSVSSLPVYPSHSAKAHERVSQPGPGFTTITSRVVDKKSQSLTDLAQKAVKL